jgi:hydrogenase maturation factor
MTTILHGGAEQGGGIVGRAARIAGPVDEPASRPLDGTLRFIRYGFMPNRLRYCGGDDNRTLFEYGLAQVTDGGLTPLLHRFTGALPYLQLIARANDIADPFDVRVVEAYWLGNTLLDHVEVRQLYDALLERFGKQLQGRTRDLVLGKAPAGAHPHHSFHVLDVHSRVGELEHSLATLESCRVSWGQVLRVDGADLVVERQPLVLRGGKLVLDDARTERVQRQIDGHGFADDATAGDWVSIHWGWVCEVLSAEQRLNLERYTRHHLRIANQTI